MVDENVETPFTFLHFLYLEVQIHAVQNTNAMYAMQLTAV